MTNNFLDNPYFYKIWQSPFYKAKISKALSTSVLSEANNILDIGCGPGISYPFFEGKNYLGIDYMPSYIAYAQRKHGDHFKLLDATKLFILDGMKFDFILINSILHHLSDDECNKVFRDIIPILSQNGYIHIIEPLIPSKEEILPTFLYKHDRGKYVRLESHWRTLISKHYTVNKSLLYSLTVFNLNLYRMVYYECKL